MNAVDFEANRYAVLRELFSDDQALRLRAHIDRLRAAEHPDTSCGRLFNRWEGVTLDPELWPIITHPSLVNAVCGVIGAALMTSASAPPTTCARAAKSVCANRCARIAPACAYAPTRTRSAHQAERSPGGPPLCKRPDWGRFDADGSKPA